MFRDYNSILLPSTRFGKIKGLTSGGIKPAGDIYLLRAAGNPALFDCAVWLAHVYLHCFVFQAFMNRNQSTM